MDYKIFIKEADSIIDSDVPLEYRDKLRNLLEDEKTDERALTNFGKSLDFNIFEFGIGINIDDTDSSDNDKVSDSVTEEKYREKCGYWDYVQIEVYKYICTDSKEYKKLREGAHEITAKVIPGLAAAIATKFGGFDVGIITTMILVVFGSILKVTKNAWCEMHKNTLIYNPAENAN